MFPDSDPGIPADTSRTVLWPEPRAPKPQPEPHPVMRELYAPPAAPILYLSVPSIAGNGIVLGPAFDDVDDAGYRRPLAMVEIECDSVPQDSTLVYLHVCPALEDPAFSQTLENTAIGRVWLSEGFCRVVLDEVRLPPGPFQLGLEYEWLEDGVAPELGATRIRLAPYCTVQVPETA